MIECNYLERYLISFIRKWNQGKLGSFSQRKCVQSQQLSLVVCFNPFMSNLFVLEDQV